LRRTRNPSMRSASGSMPGERSSSRGLCIRRDAAAGTRPTERTPASRGIQSHRRHNVPVHGDD
jgi:hypothetical protein